MQKVERARLLTGKRWGFEMDLADTINELAEHMHGEYWNITGLVDHPDLSKFQKQETDMKTLPVEYVHQVGHEDCFHGEILFPTIYPDGDGRVLFLRVTFHN